MIEQGVQVAERFLAILQTNIVEQSNDTREHWGSARSASDTGNGDEVLHDDVVRAQCRHVRVSTTSRVPFVGIRQVTPIVLD